ncbi:hypothetical protein [Pseudokineococcus sp. 1T1Z-3]|uniref:hypothetical protein n=1 Tax=Pseudokineococcus sp. 1T1Z-3 TaxID=3132745 RepID=UPI0030B458AB
MAKQEADGVMVFRTVAGRVVAGGVVVVCATALVSTAVSGLAPLVGSGGVFALVGVLAWALFWRPSVEVNPAEVVITDILRTVRIPWVTVTALDSRWSFSVETTHGTFAAWAAPGHSGMGSRLRPPRRRRGTDGSQEQDDARAEASDAEVTLAHGNDASAVALAAGGVLRDLQARGFLGAPREDIPVERSWNVSVLVALGVALGWLLVGRLVG